MKWQISDMVQFECHLSELTAREAENTAAKRAQTAKNCHVNLTLNTSSGAHDARFWLQGKLRWRSLKTMNDILKTLENTRKMNGAPARS